MFLGFVGGGRRGQESWVALKLTALSLLLLSSLLGGLLPRACRLLCRAVLWSPAFVLPASLDLLELHLSPPACRLVFRGKSYPFFLPLFCKS